MTALWVAAILLVMAAATAVVAGFLFTCMLFAIGVTFLAVIHMGD